MGLEGSDLMFRGLVLMFRGLVALALMVVLGGVVASGVSHGWTFTHVGYVLSLAVLAVLAVMPTTAKSTAGSRG
jgi:hypothetical protein